MYRTLKSILLALVVVGPASAVPAPVLAQGLNQPAPMFSLPRLGGGSISLADLAGRVVYLDFWASWCGPCRQSFPWMNEMQAKYGARGLRVVAVNVDAQQGEAESFLARIPAQFTVLFDPKGQTPALYRLQGMPTSFLIGPDGKVMLVHQSFHDSDRPALEARIEAMLGPVAPSRP